MNYKIIFLFFLFVFIHKSLCKNQFDDVIVRDSKEINVEDKNATVLFDYKDEMDFTFPLKNYTGLFSNETEDVEPQFVTLTLSINVLKKNNVTVEKIKRSWIEIDPHGEEFLVVDGERYPLELKPNVIMIFDKSNQNNSIAINLNHYNEQSLEDIKDDPTLTPIAPQELNWTLPERCDIKSISARVTGHVFSLSINNKIIARSVKIPSLKFEYSLYEGLILTVINPLSCNTSFYYVANTSEVGGFRDLVWVLDSILPGRTVVLASLRDGSAYLGNDTRQKLANEGSQYAPFYSFRDSWIRVFVKGGQSYQESFVPNVRQLINIGSPISMHFEIDNDQFGNVYDCPSWPSSARWKARKIFCEIHDGFSRLCDCEEPLEFSENPSFSGKSNEATNYTRIPIIITAGNRTRHFIHLLESLNVQEEVTKEKILVVADGHIDDVTRITFILDIKMLVHRPEGKGVMLISRNLRFALYNALQVFPSASAFIILEDDLLLSPDFYSYMTQLEPLFSLDKSVFCVSAFNHYSYPHTSHDPRLTYRVQTFPAYGWMMSRDIVEEIVPKWFPSSFVIEWDYFLGFELVAKNRECIIPDISRSYHWATGGVHFSSFFSETLYMRRTYNKVANITLSPIKRLIKDNYEEELRDLLNRSIPLQFVSRKNFDSKISEGNVYAIYVWREKESDENAFRFFAFEMDIWIYDARDNHNSTWRISYKNSTIIVVGVPHSPYSVYMPHGYKILKLLKNTSKSDFFMAAESIVRGTYKFRTHYNNINLPIEVESQKTESFKENV